MDDVIFIMLYVVTSLFFLNVTKIVKGSLLLPNTIFTLVWCFVGILSLINSVDILKPGFIVHFYIIVSILTFNVVYFFMSPIKKYEFNEFGPELEQKYEINYKMIYFVVIITILLVSSHTISAISTIRQYGFDMTLVRVTNYSNIESSSNIFLGFFTRSIPVAVVTAVSLVGSYNLNLGKRKLIITSLFMVLLYTFTFGGRYQLLNFIYFYFASYLILKRQKKIKIKKKYIIFIISILVIMTVLRGSELSLLYNAIVMYFVGSLSFLEFILNHPDLFGITDGNTYGYLTFGFILEPIVLALKLFLGLDIHVPSYYFNIHAQTFYDIGVLGQNYYNNNTTMFYNFIYDFGVLGPIIGTAIIAVLICLFESRIKKYYSLRDLFLLVYFYSVILNSTMMYTLTNINASLTIIFLLLFIKRKNKVKVEQKFKYR